MRGTVIRLVASGLVAVAAVTMGCTSKAATPNPKPANLTLADMPSGFTQSKNELLQNPAAAKEAKRSLKEINSEGRVLTSYVLFDRSSLVGLREISSEVVLYTTVAKARDDYFRSRIRITTDKSGPRAQPMSFGTIGKASSAYSLTGKGGALPFTADIVVFYEGRYVAEVGIGGITNTFDPDVLTTLARKVAKRIEALG